MEEVVIDFGDASTQVFHIGEASVAVPGLLAGLEEAHGRRGRLPWQRLFVPALELAQRGVEPEPAQAFLLEILVPILQREAGGRSIYGTPGYIDGRDLVPTLSLIRDLRSEALALLLPDLAEDLAVYEVEPRVPLDASIGGAVVLTMPAPSRGGAVVQAGLEVLDGRGDDVSGSISEARSLAAALAAGYAAAPPGSSSGSRPTGTTNVSVVDGDGTAVALSSTLGSGSGVFRQRLPAEQHARRARRDRRGAPRRGDPASEHDGSDARARGRRAATRRRQRRLRSARGCDPPGRRRRRPPGPRRRGGDLPPAAPRRRRDRPHRGRLARRRRRGARGRRLRPGRLGGREPLLRRRLRGRAETRGRPRRGGRPAARRLRVIVR